MPNDEEIAYWNADAGARWSELQERIDRAFAALSDAGIAAAAVGAGDAVLDIGCGCGATSLDLAGSAGTVFGVDVSGPMLGVAERRAAAGGIANARFQIADAAAYAFPKGVFDIAFSRFGVMFFDDPAGAFANIRSSIKPAGRLVFVCWRELGANPWFGVPLEAIRPLVPRQPSVEPDAPGPLSFANPERVRGILEHAGFEGIAFEAFDALLPFGDRNSACEHLSQIGPASRLLDGAEDDAQRAAAVGALRDALRAHESAGEVRLGASVWIVTARAGGSRTGSCQ